jgi:hypothetical protein
MLADFLPQANAPAAIPPFADAAAVRLNSKSTAKGRRILFDAQAHAAS